MRDEEVEDGSGKDVEGQRGDEEMKGRKGSLTLFERWIVEDGFVGEDLIDEESLAGGRCLSLAQRRKGGGVSVFLDAFRPQRGLG